MKNLSGNSESALCEPIKGFSLQTKHVSQLSKKSNSTQKLHYSSTSTENTRQLYARIRAKPRPMMAAIFLLLIILLSNISHSAPQIKILQSPLSNKIEQPTITAIFKDQNGFLWIGTQHGLYKFDGVKILKFSSDLPGKTWIPVSYIMQISEDSIGRIIVATLGGGLLAWNFFSDMVFGIMFAAVGGIIQKTMLPGPALKRGYSAMIFHRHRPLLVCQKNLKRFSGTQRSQR